MSTIKVNNISPQSGNDLNVTGNIIGTGAAGSLSGSFSGSFYGDGTNITGVTGEWDGSHTGNAEITGDLTVTGTLAAGGYTDISSSLHSLEGEALNRDVRLNSLETFSSSLDNYYASEADLSAHSSSIASRVSANETNISALQSFSSSLDATFATDSEVASTYVANANTGSFALSADVVDLTSSQTISGVKTLGGGLHVSASDLTLSGDLNVNNGGAILINGGGGLTINGGNISSTFTSSSLSQNFYRIQFQAQPLAVSASTFVRGNISTQLLADGSTYTNIYGTRTDIGAFNNGTSQNLINIGNRTSGSINVLGTNFAVVADTVSLVNASQTFPLLLTSIESGISASGDLIVSGTIESNQKGNKIRFHYDTEAGLPNATQYHGMFAHAHDTGYAYYAHAGNWVKLAQSSSLSEYADNVTALNAASSSYITNSQTGSFLTAADTGSLVTLAYVEANYVSKAKILAAATGSLTYNDFTGSLLSLLA